MKHLKSEINRKKKDGFYGQKAIIIPKKVIADLCQNNKIIESLYITDIGYYPKAKNHYRERLNGIDQNILIYCENGAGEISIDKRSYSLNSGEFILIPANEGHSYEASENNPWSIYWAHFKGSVSESISDLVNKNFSGNKGAVTNDKTVLSSFNEIYQQLERGYSYDNLMYANMCFWHFLTTCIYSSKYPADRVTSKKDVIDHTIDYLQSNLKKPLTLKEMSDNSHLSPSHFSFLFKNKTGFSPIEYFNHLKIQQACQYLLFTNKRIKEISFEFGIEDQYYFSRLFKKVMGISPEEYRTKRRS